MKRSHELLPCILLTCFAALLAPSALFAQSNYQLFESGQVRPLALSDDGTRLFAINTPDGQLEIYDVDLGGQLSHAGSVPSSAAIRPV